MSKIVYDPLCNNNPTMPTILPETERIIAIGDVHGDMKLVIDSLVISKVIIPVKRKTNIVSVKLGKRTYNYEWSGGKTIVVQIGDQNDSCRPINGNCDHIKNDTADDIPIFIFFTKLHELALKSGGGVYSLIGNHEIMNINGDLRYTSNSNINKFKDYTDPITNEKYTGTAEENFKQAFSNGNEYANLIGCSRQSVLIIGDFLFIHAGINQYFLENFRGRDELHRLNKLVKKWILKKLNDLQKMGMEDDTLEQLLHNSENSPFWMRVLGNLPSHLPYNDPQCKELLDPIIEAYKIKGMVIGHTPQNNGINETCGNKLFRIDVGASKAFPERREPQVLEIEKLDNGTYKYTVIFQKEEIYESIVPDDITSFGRMEARLPN
jgi:hypothetical protein